jgi:membrane protease YdiL (CAAX protease family)
MLAVLVLTDGLGEEAGWRGFALPRLLRRLPSLSAGVVLGAIWACWHLPLIWTDGATLQGASPWVLLLELPARSVVFTWIFRGTEGSALLAILLHVAMSLCVVSAATAAVGDGRVALIVLVLEWLLAAAIALAAWLPNRRGSRGPDGHAEQRSIATRSVTV